MKRIKFYIPALALVAGLSLTTVSCVDDSESPTVTALRGARAEQIKAEAALLNAQAEATKIAAEADAALTLAKAKYQEALAAGESAKLAGIQAETELAVAQAKADLQKLAISLQNDLLSLQQALDMLKNGDPVLEDAIGKYKNFLSVVNGLKISVETIKVDIAGAKGILAALEAKAPNALESQILSYKNNIADLEVDIAKDTKELAYWNKLLVSNDVKALKEEIATLKTAEEKIRFTELPPLEKAETTAKANYEKARETLMDFRYNGAMKTWSGYNEELGMSSAIYYTIPELDIQIRNITTDIKTAEAIKKQAETDLAAANGKIDGLHATLKTAEETLKDAQDARTNLPASATQQQIDAADLAVSNAWTAFNAASDAYTTQYNIIQNTQNTIVSQTDEIARLNGNLANIKEVKALYTDANTPATLETAVKTTLAALVKAEKAADDKRTDAYALESAYLALEYLTLNGSQLLSEYKPWVIKSLEQSIADSKTAVAQYNVDIATATANNSNAVKTQKANIANLESKLAVYEADLKAQEKLLAAAKKVVDDKLK